MEDNLVTVAIHTYERAIILKGILESQGIEACLHNVNLIQPMVSAGVRVRIKESDLTAALKIIENCSFNEPAPITEKAFPKTILVPVDFSDYSLKAARLAFSIAHSLDATIVLLHTYYSPFYAGGMPISDAFAYDEHGDEALKSLIAKNQDEMDHLLNQLRMEIADGKLPDIQLTSKFREGVPEEQILLYIRKHKPLMLIMGTQGAGASINDLMGSVTAEVIDRSPVPVFAFPENTPFERFEGIRNIGFLTRFDQRDLVVFDSMMQLLKPYRFKVYFLHLSTEANQWDEIQLTGIKEYFSRQYPELESSYMLLKGGLSVENLNEFIQERNIDILTVSSQKRNIFARLFNPGIAHRMVFHGNTPLLVIRS